LLFREVNERIRSLNEEFGALTGSYQIVCECESITCAERLEVPASAYESARRNGRFLVLPGHDAGERT
jgi:hypothetical protein